MTFIKPDEFIILCDHPKLTGDDLKRIHDTGVSTVFNVIYWEKVEKQSGVYDWSAPDMLVNRAKLAGMKTILRCHDNAPDYFPDDWYLRSANGSIWRNNNGFGGNERYTCLSPWCKKAMTQEHNFMKLCHERYNNEWVQVFAGGPHGGEVILPGMIPCYWDVHALESFKEFSGDNEPTDLPTYGSMKFAETTVDWLRKSLTEYVKAEQAIFPEIWLQLVERDTPFAESFECGPRSGNWLMTELCKNLPDELDKDLNVLLWEVNRQGGNQGALNNVSNVLDKTWIGSQYCEGLYHYTKDSIKNGLRGFITCPIGGISNGRYVFGKLENWMLDAFRWSLAQWRAYRL